MIVWDDLLWFLFIWITFGTTHSLLASNSIKELIPLNGRSYRIFYNILATIFFLIALIQLPSIRTLLLKFFDVSNKHMLVFLVIFILGALITSLGLLNWNLEGFAGFAEENDPLNTKGIYALSRHPVYSGIILMFLSTLMIETSAASLSWIFGGGGYFVLGSISEESKLQKFHENYNNYKQDVGRFFPWRLNHFKYIIKNFR